MIYKNSHIIHLILEHDIDHYVASFAEQNNVSATLQIVRSVLVIHIMICHRYYLDEMYQINYYTITIILIYFSSAFSLSQNQSSVERQ